MERARTFGHERKRGMSTSASDVSDKLCAMLRAAGIDCGDIPDATLAALDEVVILPKESRPFGLYLNVMSRAEDPQEDVAVACIEFPNSAAEFSVEETAPVLTLTVEELEKFIQNGTDIASHAGVELRLLDDLVE